MLTGLLPELAARATTLPFSIQSLQAEIDELSRKQDPFNNPEPKIDHVVEESDHYQQKVVEKRTLLSQQLENCTDEIRQREIVLAQLEKHNDIYPDLPGYRDFLNMAKSNMLVPRPLYMGLEWSAALKKQERNYIEECIGDDVLSTILFREHEYATARKLVPPFPQVRISTTGRTAAGLPVWMRQVFDIQASDPECLRCLASEMESSGLEPQVSLVDHKPLLAFRSHERILHGHPARLIGDESRKKALAAEIHRIKEQLKTLAASSRELNKEIDKARLEFDNLAGFKSYLHNKISEIRQLLQRGRESAQRADNCRLIFDKQQETTEALRQEVDSLTVRLTELRSLIAKEGLTNLDRKINKVKTEQTAARQASDALKKKIGGDERAVEALKQQHQVLESTLGQLRERQLAMENVLRKVLPDVDDLAHYILKTRKGQQFKSGEAITNEIENCRVAARTGVERIKMQLNNPEFGGAFRFSYEEAENELYDFRQQHLTALIGQQTTAFEEQKEVISERTRDLFKKIIMTDLMQYLRGHVGELDEMIRRINTLLRDRSFGGQRYSFKIRPLDQFKRLIDTIKKFSPFDPAAEKELADFFTDHRDTIIATEVGAIPEELDYRNWYRYEMVVATVGDEGKIIDRRNKSIGSGGEQAVPNYLLILTIAHFMYRGKKTRIHTMLFDEAFYGIDAGRRDQILGFATDLGLQLFIASPDQDGVRREVRHSTTLLVKKDANYDIHLYPFHWRNPTNRQIHLFEQEAVKPVVFGEEI
jgi:DNA repair exonuclease SbcCD ATPase subunit